jgi:uncharacterized membrane protein YecN with MAPEG domain
VTVHIVPVYAALLALFFIALSQRTIAQRWRARVAIGDGGDERLRRAARVHANFAEYTPFALLLLFFVEAQGAGAVLMHGLCAALVVGRVCHAIGVSRVPEPRVWRTVGVTLTFTVIVAAALRLLVTAFL